jgi:hypothetical protein
LYISLGGGRFTYAEMAGELAMSASEIHAAVRRLQEARLVDANSKKVRLQAFRSFLLFGVPFVFPETLGGPCRGIPTAWAAPVMARTKADDGQPQPVWPDPNGNVNGAAVRPLYPSVPHAARRNPNLWDWLALVDALRLGFPAQRALAEAEIERRIGGRH